jgi:hypothetical protein
LWCVLNCFFLLLQIALIAKRLALAVSASPTINVQGTVVQFTLYFFRLILVLPYLKLDLLTRNLKCNKTTLKVWVRVRVRIRQRVIPSQHVLHVQIPHRPA